MDSSSFAVLLLLSAAAAAAGVSPQGATHKMDYKPGVEVEGCLQTKLSKQCRATGALADRFGNPAIPSGNAWRTEMTCCKDKPKKGQRDADFAGFNTIRPTVAECDWETVVYKEWNADFGGEELKPMQIGPETFKIGQAFGTCRIDAKADECEGQAFCEDGMTLTIQGGYYIMTAYSDEPGTKFISPAGDLCEVLTEFNRFNNIFDCNERSGAEKFKEQLKVPQRQGTPHSNTTHAAGHSDKNIHRRLQEIQLTSYGVLLRDLFLTIITSGLADQSAKTLGIIDPVTGQATGGPLACSPEQSAPIRGGPYGGIAFSIIGTGTVYTQSGKFADVGSFEYTPLFFAKGQQLEATQDLPWVEGGALKMVLKERV